MKHFLILIFLVIGLTETYAQIHEERRIALVVSNNYASLSFRLNNPENDAKEVARLLDSLSFKVILKSNLDYTKMKKVIDSFCKKAKDYDVALIFFSGYGMRIGGQDFIVPNVNTNIINSEVDALREFISVEYVMNKIKDSGTRLRIGLFDACRNNPFDRELHRGIVAKPGEGEIRLYSSQPNGVAMDGEEHSPFTEGLMFAWKQYNLDLWNFINEVADYVEKKTNGRQKVSFEGDFHGVFHFSSKPDNVR